MLLWQKAKAKTMGLRLPSMNCDDMDDLEDKESLENCSFFYYYANTKGPNSINGEYLYFDS
jgi:hypothetical protein